MEIGDWILDNKTGDVYEITDRKVEPMSNWYTLYVKYNIKGEQFIAGLWTTVNDDSLRLYFSRLPNARVLYGSR